MLKRLAAVLVGIVFAFIGLMLMADGDAALGLLFFIIGSVGLFGSGGKKRKSTSAAQNYAPRQQYYSTVTNKYYNTYEEQKAAEQDYIGAVMHCDPRYR